MAPLLTNPGPTDNPTPTWRRLPRVAPVPWARRSRTEDFTADPEDLEDYPFIGWPSDLW
jgi:hypothetical protein